MKILFTASEAYPFIKTGGLGDVSYALPKALAEKGHDVKVIIPYYGRIKHGEAYAQNIKFIADFRTPLGWRQQYTGIFKYEGGNKKKEPEYLFIDNEYYFSRSDGYAIYGDYDDGEKFAFFSKAVLEALRVIDFYPDVIHCNDWQTALIPLFLHSFYPHYGNIKTVFTIHNIEYQGKMPPDFASDVLGLSYEASKIASYGGCVNLMKSAIVSADAITTVSKAYAGEILNEFYSRGLHYILRDNQYKLRGIINGIDENSFSPTRDKNLLVSYSAKTFDRKKKNKLHLQEISGLNKDENVPVVAMVSRLVGHKGLDLVECVLDEMMDSGIQLVILGTGDYHYEKMFREAAGRYPGRMTAHIAFDGKLASKLYSGADLFLMPSLSEPCGLSQLVAMRYGTVPIVRETGGLRDTVPAYNPTTKEGRGFTFVDYNAHELLYAVKRAVELYNNDRESFEELAKNNMKCDFSWRTSVAEYEELYNNLLQG